jgi:hypothetical protein
MLSITRQNGETKSRTECDKCGMGWTWSGITSFKRMEYFMREKGWEMGKKHLCNKCK